MTHVQSARFLKIIAGLFFLLLFAWSGIYAAINYSEYFPNGSTVLQSQANGWTAPGGGAAKDIATPDWCQTVTSTLGGTIFVPTGTAGEWNAFKANKPAGVSVANCYVPPPSPTYMFTDFLGTSDSVGTTAYHWGSACIYRTRQNITDGWAPETAVYPYWAAWYTYSPGCNVPQYGTY